jgi:hypothetical protein
MLTEPTAAQREAFSLLGATIPLTLTYQNTSRPARQNTRSSQKSRAEMAVTSD